MTKKLTFGEAKELLNGIDVSDDVLFTIHLPQGYAAYAEDIVYHASCNEVHVIPVMKTKTRCAACGQYDCACLN